MGVLGNDVYFDNPSSDTLVLRSTAAPAPSRCMALAPTTCCTYPQGTRSVVVRDRGGQVVDHIEGEVIHGHLDVVTPLGLACYGLTNAPTGSSRQPKLGPTHTVYPRERRWHNMGMLSVAARDVHRAAPRGDRDHALRRERAAPRRRASGEFPCDAEAP